MTLKLISLLMLIAPLVGRAQSSTTEALQKRHSDATVLYFYNNTLRMLNQKEDKAFDELIRDIEKMKFLMIRKEQDASAAESYKKLVGEYRAENYEEMMTSRFQGKSFDVFMKEGKERGMLVLINDAENLFVLDIVGSIALNKVTELYNMLDESTDIGKKIRDFAEGEDSDKGEEKSEKNSDQ